MAKEKQEQKCNICKSKKKENGTCKCFHDVDKLYEV